IAAWPASRIPSRTPAAKWPPWLLGHPCGEPTTRLANSVSISPSRGSQNDMLRAALVSDFVFAGQLALAIFGDGPRRVLLAGGFVWRGGSGGGEAGDMDQAQNPTLLVIDGVDHITCSGLVNL